MCSLVGSSPESGGIERAFDDRIHSGRPDKGPGVVVPCLQKFFDGFHQVIDTAEHSPPDSLGGQFSEPSLDQIQPTGTGRYKVQNETWMPFQPPADFLMAVCAVVVHDQMQGQIARKFLIQPAEKFQKFLVPVPREA